MLKRAGSEDLRQDDHCCTMSDDALSPSYTRAAPTNGTMEAQELT
jgi:hypothetical protein